jgi:hypothetical protein
MACQRDRFDGHPAGSGFWTIVKLLSHRYSVHSSRQWEGQSWRRKWFRKANHVLLRGEVTSISMDGVEIAASLKASGCPITIRTDSVDPSWSRRQNCRCAIAADWRRAKYPMAASPAWLEWRLRQRAGLAGAGDSLERGNIWSMKDFAEAMLCDMRALIAEKYEPLPPDLCVAVFVMEKRGPIDEDAGQNFDVTSY